MEALFFSYITTLHLKVYFSIEMCTSSLRSCFFFFFFFVGTFHLMTNPYLILLIRNFVIFIYISFFFFFFFPEASSRKCGVGWEVGLDSTCYQINSDQRKLWAGL